MSSLLLLSNLLLITDSSNLLFQIFIFLIDPTSTLKPNPPIIDPKFLFPSNFESNHRDFHVFTDSQGNTFTARDIPASQQSLWMFPIFTLPTPPQPHHLSIQSNISNTTIFMNHIVPQTPPISTSTSSNEISTISGNVTFTQSLMIRKL